MRSAPASAAARIIATAPSTLARIISSGTGHPEPVIGGDVHDIAAPGGGAGERGGIGQVAGHDLGVEPVQVAPVAGGPRQQPQRVAAARQGARDGGADEAGGAGDQGGHASVP